MRLEYTQSFARCTHGCYFVPAKSNRTLNAACSICSGLQPLPKLMTAEEFKKKQRMIEPEIEDGITVTLDDPEAEEEAQPEQDEEGFDE